MHTKAHILTTSPGQHLHLVIALEHEAKHPHSFPRILGSTKCVLIAHAADDAVQPGSICRFIPQEDRFVLCGSI